MKLPNPLIPGFNPDPSVVRVARADAGVDYYLVTSSFEYLPGIPIYHSTDLAHWRQIGHVLTHPNQFDASDVPTGGGVWAPTIRWHDSRFHVIVSVMGQGTRIYTATDPAGLWSDGTLLDGLNGIDPDLSWDEDGNCYVTISGLLLSGDNIGSHLGIQQVRVDTERGAVLEPPRTLWSGTGGMFPEAPHLYRIGEWWYLLIAEGGTERGHAVTIARGRSPMGPFEGCPWNPIVTARGSSRPIQNTGHGDLVEAPDGSWSMVLLGMRVRGLTRSFSALGRETFGTHVDWRDGWPIVEPVIADEDPFAPSFADDFSDAAFGLDWVGVRRFPESVATRVDGRLRLQGEGRTMDHSSPTFVGRRQRRLDARAAATIRDPSTGIGGLSMRYDEEHHYDLEVRDGQATARVVLPSLRQEWRVAVPAGPIELVLETHPVTGSFASPDGDLSAMTSRMTCDVVRFIAVDATGQNHHLATVDGRYLSAETACSFTGRVTGMYCVEGALEFTRYQESPLSLAP